MNKLTSPANYKQGNLYLRRRDMLMYYYKEELINIIKPDKPDPAAAKVLQETLGVLKKQEFTK